MLLMLLLVRRGRLLIGLLVWRLLLALLVRRLVRLVGLRLAVAGGGTVRGPVGRSGHRGQCL